MVVEKTLSGMDTDLISKLKLDRWFILVSDASAPKALGSRIESNLQSAFKINTVNLPGHPIVNMKYKIDSSHLFR
jgi:hypothetical protein